MIKNKAHFSSLIALLCLFWLLLLQWLSEPISEYRGTILLKTRVSNSLFWSRVPIWTHNEPRLLLFYWWVFICITTIIDSSLFHSYRASLGLRKWSLEHHTFSKVSTELVCHWHRISSLTIFRILNNLFLYSSFECINRILEMLRALLLLLLLLLLMQGVRNTRIFHLLLAYNQIHLFLILRHLLLSAGVVWSESDWRFVGFRVWDGCSNLASLWRGFGWKGKWDPWIFGGWPGCMVLRVWIGWIWIWMVGGIGVVVISI